MLVFYQDQRIHIQKDELMQEYFYNKFKLDQYY